MPTPKNISNSGSPSRADKVVEITLRNSSKPVNKNKLLMPSILCVFSVSAWLVRVGQKYHKCCNNTTVYCRFLPALQAAFAYAPRFAAVFGL